MDLQDKIKIEQHLRSNEIIGKYLFLYLLIFSICASNFDNGLRAIVKSVWFIYEYSHYIQHVCLNLVYKNLTSIDSIFLIIMTILLYFFENIMDLTPFS